MAEILQFPPIARVNKKLSKWRITRIRGAKADSLGTVEATNAETAIKTGIKQFKITDPHKQKRIAAMPD